MQEKATALKKLELEMKAATEKAAEKAGDSKTEKKDEKGKEKKKEAKKGKKGDEEENPDELQPLEERKSGSRLFLCCMPVPCCGCGPRIPTPHCWKIPVSRLIRDLEQAQKETEGLASN